MQSDDFKRELIYQATLAHIRAWLNKGIITEEEYADLAEFFDDKYHPIIGSLCLT